MADQVDNKPAPIKSIAKERPTLEKKENPLEGLGREIRGGFKRLEDRLGAQQIKPQESGGKPSSYHYAYNTNSNTTINPANREQPSFKSPSASAVRMPVIGAITGVAPATTPRASPGAPAGVAPIADQRAHQALSSGRAQHVEADATRMAKVSEAAEKMKKGEFPANPKIREWDSAIRGGRQREIADLDPKTVNRTLEQAAGGSHGAQQLNTPKVAHIEAEHQTRSQVLQKGLEARQTATERSQAAHPAQAAPNAKETKIQAVESAVRQPAHTPSEAHGFNASHASSAPAPVHNMQNPELTFMLRHNDESHSASAVASIEHAQKNQTPEAKGKDGQRADVHKMSQIETPKVGSVGSASSGNQAETPKVGSVSSMPAGEKSGPASPPDSKKAPWGEGRELREMADKLGSILTAIERIGR